MKLLILLKKLETIWVSADEKSKSGIDYIISDKKAIFQDVSVLNYVLIESDHRIVCVNFKRKSYSKKFHQFEKVSRTTL